MSLEWNQNKSGFESSSEVRAGPVPSSPSAMKNWNRLAEALLQGWHLQISLPPRKANYGNMREREKARDGYIDWIIYDIMIQEVLLGVRFRCRSIWNHQIMQIFSLDHHRSSVMMPGGSSKVGATTPISKKRPMTSVTSWRGGTQRHLTTKCDLMWLTQSEILHVGMVCSTFFGGLEDGL